MLAPPLRRAFHTNTYIVAHNQKHIHLQIKYPHKLDCQTRYPQQILHPTRISKSQSRSFINSLIRLIPISEYAAASSTVMFNFCHTDISFILFPPISHSRIHETSSQLSADSGKHCYRTGTIISYLWAAKIQKHLKNSCNDISASQSLFALRKASPSEDNPLDVHLLIEHPQPQIPLFSKNEATVSIHPFIHLFCLVFISIHVLYLADISIGTTPVRFWHIVVFPHTGNA